MNTRRINLRWCDINIGDFKLEKLVTHFAQSNRAEGKSPKTIAWYTEMIAGFIWFLADTGRGSVLANFDISIVREFIIHEQERGLSAFSVQDKARDLRAFASWLYRDIAILVLLLDTGLRISELSSLRSDNVNIEEGYLRIMGKGSNPPNPSPF